MFIKHVFNECKLFYISLQIFIIFFQNFWILFYTFNCFVNDRWKLKLLIRHTAYFKIATIPKSTETRPRDVCRVKALSDTATVAHDYFVLSLGIIKKNKCDLLLRGAYVNEINIVRFAGKIFCMRFLFGRHNSADIILPSWYFYLDGGISYIFPPCSYLIAQNRKKLTHALNENDNKQYIIMFDNESIILLFFFLPLSKGSWFIESLNSYTHRVLNFM